MDINYELHLGNLHTLRNHNGIEDIVISIEFTYSGRAQVNGINYSYGITDSVCVLQAVEDLNADNFIDYNDISLELATEWVLGALSEDKIESMKMMIRSQIESQTLISVKRAPWVTISQATVAEDQTVTKE